MFSFYNLFMKPLERMGINKARKNLIKLSHGAVLEVGAGTGANLAFYNFDKISTLDLTDLSKSKHLMTENAKITITETSVTSLPFEDGVFDYVVHTLVFCSVGEVVKGLNEIKRVLKADGKLIFIEHVLPEKRVMKRTFKLLNPVWKTISGGCQLTKDYVSSLKESGFVIEEKNYFGSTVFVSGIASKMT